MNLDKKNKSRSLRAPFKKLYEKLSSRSSSPAPDDRSDGNSQDSGPVATPVPIVASVSFSSSSRTAVEEPANQEDAVDWVIPGNMVGSGLSGGQGSHGPAVTVTGTEHSTHTLFENLGDRDEEKADEGVGGELSEEPSTGRRVAALAYEGLKESLRLVVRCMDAVPVVKSATQGVLEIFERYDAITGIPSELTELKEKLHTLASILQENDVSAIRDRLSGLARTFEEKTKVINGKLERTLGGRIIESTKDTEFLSREIRSITFAVEIVMMDVNLKTHSIVAGLQHIALLDKLEHVKGSGYGHEDRQGCADGTRVLLLADLLMWATELESEPIFWLNGMAGTGKTTVTETFCNLLACKGILGSSFFCSHKTSNRCKVNLIFPSLVSALAYKYSEFQKELVQVLQNCLDPTGMDLEKQFKTLLIEPARIAFARHSECIVLVVDALDECEDQQAAEKFLKIILKEKSSGVLRFFVTSRPETKIRKGFSTGVYDGVRLHDIEAHIVKADIRVFLLAAFEEIEDLQTEYDGQWPPAELDTIVENSGNLFIYAATAVKYISDERGDPIERLRKYAAITPPSNAVEAIDEVYLFVLKDTFHQLDDDEQQRVQLCLQTIVCALEPLSVAMYSMLLGISVLQVRRAFSSLHSVVQIPEDKKNDLKIVLYHASFPDYLTSASRTKSAVWYVDVSSAHTMLVDHCLQVMMSKLHFNIANAVTSYQSNKAQSLTIEPELEYICCNWPNHLFLSVIQPDLILEAVATRMEQFFLQKFLFWLEVLSVTNQAQHTAATLSRIYSITESSTLRNICREFATFVSKHLVAINLSAPHIYLSALPWVASDSILGQNFLSKFSHLPKIIDSKQPEAWQPLVVQLHGHTDRVNCIAYSPDGKNLASGSHDETIRIWSIQTRQQQTLQIGWGVTVNGAYRVFSLAYSPNSQYIVSGYYDGMIIIWDTKTGKPTCKPLLGHNKAVLSIAISSNGKFIASGSSDMTVRLWDFQTRKQVYAAFSSHTSVRSVAFSPNSKFLASGDDHCCIRVWNAQTGDMVSTIQKDYKENDSIYSMAFTPDGQSVLCALFNKKLKIWDLCAEQEEKIFSGHLDSVISTAFSPNGAYIVSGSSDNTVRLWSAETRKELIPALSGHSSFITSVAFALDGKSVASGSADKTINIWHISEALQHSGQAVDDSAQSTPLSESLEMLLEGHNDTVTSVVFSPDGKYVASGCTDNTVGIWHTDTGMPKLSLLKGHKGSVSAVAWSPDNKLIASGSDDKTIILWNADTGTLDGVLEGHSAGITCVAFSPDTEHLVSSSYDKTVRIWSLKTRKQAHEALQGHSDNVNSVAYSANSNMVVSCSDDRTVRVWSATTGAIFTTPLMQHNDTVTSAVFTVDGKYIISGSTDGFVRVWDIHADFKMKKALSKDPVFPISRAFIISVAVTPDGKYALAALSDNTACIWSLVAGEITYSPLIVLIGHNRFISSIAASPDSKYVATGAADTTIRIWNFSAATSSQNTSETCFLQHYNPQPYLDNDGWCTFKPKKDLFLWMPPTLSAHLYTPHIHCIIGKRKINIDVSDYAHGTEWVECGLTL